MSAPREIKINVGDYVLVDPCRFGGAHPQAWVIGTVERELEQKTLRRFLIRYMAMLENGIQYRIHSPRSMRAIGTQAHVRAVFDGVLAHMRGFAKERTKLDKEADATNKMWDAYSTAKDKLENKERDIWCREQAAMKALRQPGLLRWSRNGGVQIDKKGRIP
jgi:hypothetical protein